MTKAMFKVQAETFTEIESMKPACRQVLRLPWPEFFRVEAALEQ